MSKKRRDSKNHILRMGESQRQDGRYRYKYFDSKEQEKNIYSWRLDSKDPFPTGKKKELSLREKEKQIALDIYSGIVPDGGNHTVLSLCEKNVI